MKTKERKIKIEGIKADLYIIPERCKGCGFCISFCPKNGLYLSDEVNEKGYHYPAMKNPDECSACKMCEYLCPDFAIYVVSRRKNNNSGNNKK